MAFNLRNRSFLKELDFIPEELRFLLKLAAESAQERIAQNGVGMWRSGRWGSR